MREGATEVMGRALRLAASIFSLFAVGLLTGCAFTRTPVKVNFSPSVSQPVRTPAKAALEVGEMQDSRLVGDPFILLHKANEYGPTSGAYVTVTPVAKIFREGVKEALDQNGFMGTNGVQYELRGQINGFGVGFIQNGVLSSPTSKGWLEVRFELVDKAKGLPVWHDTFTGQVTGSVSVWTGADKDDLAAAFSGAAQDAVKQLIGDAEFRNFFE